jgi:hypothetical protein
MNPAKMRFTILLFLLLCLNKRSPAQQFIQPEQYAHTFCEHAKPVVYLSAQNNTNELQYIFSGLFLFYKFALSSQDSNKCAFHPSCSEYGMMAVKKYGALKGMLATLDRLQRCNGFSPELYDLNPQTLLLTDYP